MSCQFGCLYFWTRPQQFGFQRGLPETWDKLCEKMRGSREGVGVVGERRSCVSCLLSAPSLGICRTRPRKRDLKTRQTRSPVTEGTQSRMPSLYFNANFNAMSDLLGTRTRGRKITFLKTIYSASTRKDAHGS